MRSLSSSVYPSSMSIRYITYFPCSLSKLILSSSLQGSFIVHISPLPYGFSEFKVLINGLSLEFLPCILSHLSFWTPSIHPYPYNPPSFPILSSIHSHTTLHPFPYNPPSIPIQPSIHSHTTLHPFTHNPPSIHIQPSIHSHTTLHPFPYNPPWNNFKDKIY